MYHSYTVLQKRVVQFDRSNYFSLTRSFGSRERDTSTSAAVINPYSAGIDFRRQNLTSYAAGTVYVWFQTSFSDTEIPKIVVDGCSVS